MVPQMLLQLDWIGQFGQSENQAMRSKKLSVELRDRIVSRQIWGRKHEHFCSIEKVPKSTVASIILKWKRFGTTISLRRSRHPAKLSNIG